MSKILLVEDSKSSQHLVRAALESADIEMTVSGTLTDGLNQASQTNFDLILLDLSLPDGEGLTLLREIQARASNERIPVLLLTGKEDLQSKVAAFTLGAEDYLVKPVDPVELRARVEMRLRKARESKPVGEVIKRGPFTLNFSQMRATIVEQDREHVIDFTTKEYKIVATLARHENQIFTRQQLVEAIWGENMHVVDRTVDSHICGARRKMGPAGRYIQSVTGEGYRFTATE
jgi:DNA-binding response OmpR family regulator